MMRGMSWAAMALMAWAVSPATAQLCEIPGDMNCDEVVDCNDVDPFVLALTDAEEYENQYPGCPITNADVNDDGYVNFGDINPFSDLLEKRHIVGDMNCDGCVDMGDLSGLLMAINYPCTWKQQHPDCWYLNGDINGDGFVNSNDLTPFIEKITNLTIAGDMDCNQCIDEEDIDPFVLALTDPDAYEAQYPDCHLMNADVNGDGYVNFGDINPFSAMFESGCD